MTFEFLKSVFGGCLGAFWGVSGGICGQRLGAFWRRFCGVLGGF